MYPNRAPLRSALNFDFAPVEVRPDDQIGAFFAEPAERQWNRARTRGSQPSRATRAGPESYQRHPAAPRDRAAKHRGLQKRKAEPAGTALTTQRGATAKQRPAHTRSEGRLRRHPSPRNRAEKPLSACGLEECGGGCRAGYGIAEIPAGVGGEVLRGGRPDPL
ncbi:hypothetical protein NDU88_006237 [Pleurodeles waltl]|uniref:Uncharacterized protein n=1 Tax=Pleurodeles waltl TaxID=8319 RepID=A0AAV7QHH3_PLEWA|nr:hypothetical protein NDU88_006237 [Pleurodeles waltl]